NPLYDQVMASLKITRDEALFLRRVASDVLLQLREKMPEQEFEFDEKGIRGKNQAIYLGNLYKEVQASPKRRDSIIKHFVDKLSLSHDVPMGAEVWEEVRGDILPMLKPRDYIDPNSPTQHLLTTEWLVDVVIVYVIRNKGFFRFVTGWDVNRWETT